MVLRRFDPLVIMTILSLDPKPAGVTGRSADVESNGMSLMSTPRVFCSVDEIHCRI